MRPVASAPVIVEKSTRAYLDAVDRRLPSYVRGLYLVGSAALNAWQPGVSDIDTVILTSRTASTDDVVPFVVNGEFRTDRPCGELTPVLWLTLRRYGRVVRGPAVDELDVRVDQDELRRYNLDNLRDYWQGVAREIRSAVAGEKPGQIQTPAP